MRVGLCRAGLLRAGGLHPIRAGMGRVLLYVGCGYILLVLVSSALFTGPGGLPLLVLAAIVFFLYRSGVLAKLRPQANEPFELARALGSPAARDDGLLSDALGYACRFDEAEGRLAAALPEDPLENEALVEVLAAYLHEPPEARASVEDEYRSRREQLLDWRQRAHLLGSPHGLEDSALRAWLREAQGLDVELSALEAYAADIRHRANAMEGLAEQAVEQATRAGELLTAARAACAALDDARSAEFLSERLDVAEAKRREAWDTLEKGKERPVTALRLADESAALADDVKQRAARIAALPEEIKRRLSELETSIEQVQADLERVHDGFETAAASYAPSCWHEIGGVGHAARRALERARRLRESAARLAGSSDPNQLEHAEREAGEARLAVDDAARLREAIERHLEKLETAAVEGRDLVLRAEQGVDRAWSAVHEHGGRGGENELLQRAADLVQEARAALARPQPDWLTIVELANRGAELAREAQAGRSIPIVNSASPRLALEDAKARAKESRDAAWAEAIVRPATAATAPSLLEAAEDAYQAAVRVEASLGDAPDEGTLKAALAAFEEAERMAAGFSRQVEDPEDARALPREAGDAHSAHTLVWDLKLTRTVRP
jgi:hypothetical protein